MNIIFYFDTAGSIVEHNIKAPVFGVRSFERGYYPIYTGANAAQLNHKIPADVLESALCASVFGWDTPAASAARKYCEEKERTQP